jgi:hypothetical protein
MDFHQKDDSEKNIGKIRLLSKFSKPDLLGSVGTLLGKTCLGYQQQKVAKPIFSGEM